MAKNPDFHGHMNEDGSVTFTALSDAAKARVGVQDGAPESITVDLAAALDLRDAIEGEGFDEQDD